MSDKSIYPSSLPDKPHAIRRFLNTTLKLPPLSHQGFSHFTQGHYVMLAEEFELILAYEPKAVTQVILELFKQTIGRPGEGPGGRLLWAKFSTRQLVRKGLISHSQARKGIQLALEKGYIFRRRVNNRDYEYAIHFKNIDYGTFEQVLITDIT
jgi:hypothetical protein